MNATDTTVDEVSERPEIPRAQRCSITSSAPTKFGRHTRQLPLQALAQISSGDSIATDQITDSGMYPVYGGNGIRGYTDACNQTVDRVLIGRQGALCGNVHLAPAPFWASEHALVLVPYAPINLRWLAYVTRELDLGRLSTAAAQPGITASGVARETVPYISLDSQTRIADYLDRETGEIDAMLGKMDELVDRLRLRKSTLGSRIFTLHFEEVKLKWILDEIDERAGDSSTVLPLLSVSIHYGVQLREESSSKQKASEDLSNYKIARAGEIVLNRMRAFQGGLGQARVDGLVSPDYSVLRPRGQLSPSWAAYVMRSPEFVALMSQRLRGIGSADQSNVRTPRINVRDLVDLAIPLPSGDEQRRIIAELDGATARVDAMLAKVADLKALLLERRAALITDVVTGRKEVA